MEGKRERKKEKKNSTPPSMAGTCPLRQVFPFASVMPHAAFKDRDLTDGGIFQLPFLWSDASRHFVKITAADSLQRNVEMDGRDKRQPVDVWTHDGAHPAWVVLTQTTRRP